MVRQSARPGYTLLEVLVVMAALLILGAVLLPTITGLSRDTKTKAGADLLRGMLAEGRSQAIERNHNYALSVSPDGTQFRIAPDFNDPVNATDEMNNAYLVREDKLPFGVTAACVNEDAIPDEDGWVRIVTLLTDGTCLEDQSFVEITESGVKPLTLMIRGLTGSASVVENAPGG
jgi:prepilin-type N-terminal cleavage/methylation domain-containing protein